METRIYGPVPSRRFGLSLGVDLVPHKTCTLDCIYCQLGPTTAHSCVRQDFYPLTDVARQIAAALERGPEPDVLTFAGSGEPTLYDSLGRVVEYCRAYTSADLLLITNGTLLYRPDVAVDAMKFDVVAPSLDAGDPATWAAVNGPMTSMDFGAYVDGLQQFAREFRGRLYLEVFFVKGVNDSPQSVDAIVELADAIGPDRVDLNTVVRPAPGRKVEGVTLEFLEAVASRFSAPAAPIAAFRPRSGPAESAVRIPDGPAQRVLETLSRRPCTMEDLCSALGFPAAVVSEALATLGAQGLVEEDYRGGSRFFVRRN